MKKVGTVFVLVLLASALVLPMVAAIPRKNVEREHKGVAQHLYLYEKDPSEWTIVEDGAWGHLIYHDSGQSSGKFVFNGHLLEPDTDYSLIYYPDPWPGTGLQVLGRATSDEDGNVHIMGKNFDFAGIPISGDTNQGAKIWLVLSADIVEADIVEGYFIHWNPTEYLFENNLI